MKILEYFSFWQYIVLAMHSLAEIGDDGKI